MMINSARLLSGYIKLHSQLETSRKDSEDYTKRLQPPCIALNQLQTHNRVIQEFQKSQSSLTTALTASVVEVAQSGLWHLATPDTSPKLRLEKRVEELKGVIEELGVGMRSLKAQIDKGKTHGSVFSPPTYDSDVPMDLENDSEDTTRAKKRRRVSREGSSVSTLDEEVIEQELFSEEEGLQEKFASLENRLGGVEDTIVELQRDASEMDDALEEKWREVQKTREKNEKDAADLRALAASNREVLGVVQNELTTMDNDVRALAAEAARQLLRSETLSEQNTALKEELERVGGRSVAVS